MHPLLEEICTALDSLATSVKVNADTRTYQEMYGGNCVALTANDLAFMSENLSLRIRRADIRELDEIVLQQLTQAPKQLLSLMSQTVPNFRNGNCVQSVPSYIATLTWLSSVIEPVLAWKVIDDPKSMPAALHARIQTVQSSVNRVVSDSKDIENKIELINRASEAADNLPATLETLSQTQREINGLRKQSQDACNESTAKAILSNEELTKAKNHVSSISQYESQAKDLVSASEKAYRMTTSISLAGAFEERAKEEKVSIRFWVGGLLCALMVGSYIGGGFLTELSKLISEQTPNWDIVWLKTGLTIVGLGAPIWFAWLATKQISYKFKLSEDYSYKAAVSKAYEGYRKEASRIDPAFEARLFATALTRLEEAPLRLVDEAIYGSPWAEFIASKQFQGAMESMPELKERFIHFVESATDRIGNVLPIGGVKSAENTNNDATPSN